MSTSLWAMCQLNPWDAMGGVATHRFPTSGMTITTSSILALIEWQPPPTQMDRASFPAKQSSTATIC
eukprot:CAMPEP_0196724920 /NCGR_PEP_ID=MMETSP1091-20130531/6627_1 /TAXON_ID=302021 /ORGANISM="Rhodomonas sp., Strain CCMP768" /LENGTH=66 /DNA_ID=CAMNT_0042067125 /DNA_START=134 /DNA_END=334 /DNA_ORIENTATION=-